MDEYYQVIGLREEGELIKERMINFSTRDISILKKYFTYNFTSHQHNNGHDDYIYLRTSEENNGNYIISFQDEWYLVYFVNINIRYKCDQLDGLIKCLEDNYEK